MPDSERNKLYNEGMDIYKRCHEHRESLNWQIYPDVYDNWRKKAVTFLEENDSKNFETLFRNEIPLAPLCKQSVSLNPDSFIGSNSADFNNFFSLFKDQLDYLNTSNVITLKIDTDRKVVTRETEKGTLELAFRRSSGKNKRFEYLVKIAKNPRIGSKELSDTGYQNVSSEIGKINKNTKEKLKLIEKLIINTDNTGYEINGLYKIDFM